VSKVREGMANIGVVLLTYIVLGTSIVSLIDVIHSGGASPNETFSYRSPSGILQNFLPEFGFAFVLLCWFLYLRFRGFFNHHSGAHP
jgi:hypothetical protein